MYLSFSANENCKKMLNDWGLRLPVDSVQLPARTLDPETIYFGRDRKVQEPKADWGRAMSSNHVLIPVSISIRFVYICLGSVRAFRAVNVYLVISKTNGNNPLSTNGNNPLSNAGSLSVCTVRLRIFVMFSSVYRSIWNDGR